jgi:hypothetical protein
MELKNIILVEIMFRKVARFLSHVEDRSNTNIIIIYRHKYIQNEFPKVRLLESKRKREE